MKQVCHSESAIVHVDYEEKDVLVNEQEERSFKYTLNEKKAKAKLLKGANRKKS